MHQNITFYYKHFCQDNTVKNCLNKTTQFFFEKSHVSLFYIHE